MTHATLADAQTDLGHGAPGGPAPARLALVALAMGGFAIGTTEFVTMGLLPEIAAGVNVAPGQSLAAALNHSTLNIANALGAWLGSLVLAAGL